MRYVDSNSSIVKDIIIAYKYQEIIYNSHLHLSLGFLLQMNKSRETSVSQINSNRYELLIAGVN